MPGKGKGKQKKKQQPSNQPSKPSKTVKQPEENDTDSDIDNREDDLDIEPDADHDALGTEEPVTVKSKIPEDQHTSLQDTKEVSDKSKSDLVKENGALGDSPSIEKKLTRKEMKKMKKKACKHINSMNFTKLYF